MSSTKTLVITWSPRCPDAQLVRVVGESTKAIRIENVDTGRTAWIPKSGLTKYVPPKLFPRDVADDEFTVADWFRAKCSIEQMAALGYAE